MKKELLIIGSDGYIGSHLLKIVKPLYYTSRKSTLYPINLENPNLKALPLEKISHAIIAAGCANIPFCETHPKQTYQINVKGTLDVVKTLTQKGVFPIVFSSDYVFDGVSGNYDEMAPTRPLNIYGRQKAELEEKISAITQGNHLILRLSKIYSTRRGDGTLLDEIISRLTQDLPVYAATDQMFCPLTIDDLVTLIQKLIESNVKGLYNIGGSHSISRYALAQKMATQLNFPLEKIVPIQLNSLNPSVVRPLNTSLCSNKVLTLLQYTPTSITESIQLIKNNHLHQNSNFINMPI